MAAEHKQTILSQYDEKYDVYAEFVVKVESLVAEILEKAGVRAHSITSRVKDRESLRKKVARPDKDYAELSDITDVAGVRIITYFEDDVDKVARDLETVFVVDRDNSIDRRKTLDPDRFGYLSLHHVASFGSNRTALLEYRKFIGMKVEIQTRSILQHAWAEMEHDLGYKSQESIPREVRRRFSRLAGLLEIADQEFRRLRDDLEQYREDVSQQIASDPQEVEINKDSLSAFIAESTTVARIDAAIASSYGVNVEYWDVDETWEFADLVTSMRTDTIEKNVQFLETFGVRTIQDLETELSERETQIVAFAWEHTKPPREAGRLKGNVLQGVSVSNLVNLLAGQTRNVEEVGRFLRRKGLIDYRGFSIDEEARRIIGIYNLISNRSS